MSPSETRMPHSTIRHRPIFTTPQVTPRILRASTLTLSIVPSIGGEGEPSGPHWHIAFCLGMAMTLALLLFGHFVG